MSISDIAVTALTAVATVKGNALTITTSDPRSGALPNIALDHVDIYASQTDTFASASVVTQGTLRAIHADAGEEQTWYYWGIPYDKIGGAGTRYPAGATGGVACTSLGQAGLMFGLSNGKLVASVAANALTIAVKTASGNDPSANDPVSVAFRNSTLATGNYIIRIISSAFSATVPNSALLGITPALVNTPFRVWVVALDDAGTPRLGVTVCYTGSTIGQLDESTLVSSFTLNTASDAERTIYSSVAVTNCAMRIIGFLDFNSGLAVEGQWSVAPDKVQMAYWGMPRPGQVVQDTSFIHAGTASGTTVIPYDNTKPQATEGVGLPIFSIVPTSPVNVILNEACVRLTYSVAAKLTLSLIKSGVADSLAATWGNVSAADDPATLYLSDIVQARSSSSLVFSYRAGGSVAGTVYYNQLSSGGMYGGVLKSSYRQAEIMV